MSLMPVAIVAFGTYSDTPMSLMPVAIVVFGAYSDTPFVFNASCNCRIRRL